MLEIQKCLEPLLGVIVVVVGVVDDRQTRSLCRGEGLTLSLSPSATDAKSMSWRHWRG
jgi:hypothetical protein